MKAAWSAGAILGAAAVLAAYAGVATYRSSEAAIVDVALGRLRDDAAAHAQALTSLASRIQTQILAATRSEVVATAISYGANPSQVTAVGRDVAVLVLREPAIASWSLIEPSTGHGTGGFELARVERTAEGTVRLVREPELVARTSDPAVLGVYSVKVGAVFSTLARANGSAGEFPVVRMSTGIPELIGDLAPATMFAIFALDIDLRPALQAMASAATSARLVDDHGLYVGGASAGKRLGEDLPALAAALRGADAAALRTVAADGTDVAAAGASVRLPGGPRLLVVEDVAVPALLAGQELVREAVTVGGTAGFLAAMALFVAATLFADARRNRRRS